MFLRALIKVHYFYIYQGFLPVVIGDRITFAYVLPFMNICGMRTMFFFLIPQMAPKGKDLAPT